MIDKIYELIHPIEVNFKEDPDFSKEFYVLTGDEWEAKTLVDGRFRNCLKQFRRRDTWIEFAEDKLIIGNQKYIDTQATLEMAGLLGKMAQLQK